MNTQIPYADPAQRADTQRAESRPAAADEQAAASVPAARADAAGSHGTAGPDSAAGSHSAAGAHSAAGSDGAAGSDDAAGPDGAGSSDEATWTPPTWDEVVRKHAGRVYRLAYRLSGNPYDAEDLTQETFIRVFRSLASYRPGTFEGWLHRITTNLFLDMVRRRSRVRMENLPEDTDRVVGDDPSPEQVFWDAYLDPDLQAALDELHPDFRAAVVLCDVEGLSYEEIGATLGVKLGTVRSRIHRGRQALRTSLERRRAASDAGVGLDDAGVSP